MDIQKISGEDALQHHSNIPQLKFMLVDAPDTTLLWARATGKTEEPMADRVFKQMTTMPRGLFVFQGSTYKQLLTYTLPKVIKGLAKRNLHRDLHFFVGKEAPKNWNWDKPYTDPLRYDNCIHTYTGATFLMLSQDGVADGNGLDCDGINMDEARFLSKQKLDDTTFPTNRGNEKYFRNNHLHHGVLTISDMPLTPEGNWLFEAEAQMDVERVNLVLQFEYQIAALWQDLMQQTGKTIRTKLYNEINSLKAKANTVRSSNRALKIPRMSYYSEASTLDNIDVLGEDFIRQAKQKMGDYQFGVSILGKRPTKIEGGYYSWLDDKVHCYNGYNHAYLRDKLLESNVAEEYEDSCYEMAYCNLNEPIEIGVDWGSHFNCLVSFQSDNYTGRFLKDMWVQDEKSLLLLADKFCKYFQAHRTKTYVHHFDHTAISADGVRESYVDEFEKRMKANGWTCIRKYMGQAPDPKDRYLLWIMASDKDRRMPTILFDKDLTRDLRKSMSDCATIVDAKGFRKDKSIEKKKDKNGNPLVPYQYQPHLSDAADMVLWGKYGDLLYNNRRSDIPVQFLGR